MFDAFISIGEKIINWLVSLSVKPRIKITEFHVTKTSNENWQLVKLALITSNSYNKSLSLSEKYLCFYKDKTELSKIAVTRYEVVKEKDSFDELNRFLPIDDIIMLQPGESTKICFCDEIELLNKANMIKFSYYTGRRTYTYRIKL